jgi:hypothetical protein
LTAAFAVDTCLVMAQCGAPSPLPVGPACAVAGAELKVPVRANAVTGAPMMSSPAAAAPATTVARL